MKLIDKAINLIPGVDTLLAAPATTMLIAICAGVFLGVIVGIVI